MIAEQVLTEGVVVTAIIMITVALLGLAAVLAITRYNKWQVGAEQRRLDERHQRDMAMQEHMAEYELERADLRMQRDRRELGPPEAPARRPRAEDHR